MNEAGMGEYFISRDSGAYAPPKPVLITGGAGFIGTNLAMRLASLGQQVLIYDNLSRAGVEKNLNWLTANFPQQIHVKIADVRNQVAITQAVDNASMVFHLAAQVAVTTSIDTPMRDFEVNVLGTLNVLEAIRTSKHRPPMIFTSTNKVYGNMESFQLTAGEKRYEGADVGAANGFDESTKLDFCSPYGCSKGAADQYVLDYARTYDLRAAVFRMSCIYGPHQHGTEDQGWVAHFISNVINGRPITIFGDGKQVRDLLYVDDLVNAFILAQNQIESISGKAFNVGGGPENAMSVLEVLDVIAPLSDRKPHVEFKDWRRGDQRFYISNSWLLSQITGWERRVSVTEGIELLFDWLAGRAQAKAGVGQATLNTVGA